MSRTPSKIATSRTEAASLPCSERYAVHGGLGHAVLLAPGARRHQTTYALRGCSPVLLAGSKPAVAVRRTVVRARAGK
jgi:hypothetical protein